jgi:hypothetical protein
LLRAEAAAKRVKSGDYVAAVRLALESLELFPENTQAQAIAFQYHRVALDRLASDFRQITVSYENIYQAETIYKEMDYIQDLLLKHKLMPRPLLKPNDYYDPFRQKAFAGIAQKFRQHLQADDLPKARGVVYAVLFAFPRFTVEEKYQSIIAGHQGLLIRHKRAQDLFSLLSEYPWVLTPEAKRFLLAKIKDTAAKDSFQAVLQCRGLAGLYVEEQELKRLLQKLEKKAAIRIVILPPSNQTGEMLVTSTRSFLDRLKQEIDDPKRLIQAVPDHESLGWRDTGQNLYDYIKAMGQRYARRGVKLEYALAIKITKVEVQEEGQERHRKTMAVGDADWSCKYELKKKYGKKAVDYHYQYYLVEESIAVKASAEVFVVRLGEDLGKVSQEGINAETNDIAQWAENIKLCLPKSKINSDIIPQDLRKLRDGRRRLRSAQVLIKELEDQLIGEISYRVQQAFPQRSILQPKWSP